jgi:hypothetical protein
MKIRVTGRLLQAALLVCTFAGAAHAQEWQYGAFVDGAYIEDPNDPANNVFRSRGTAWHVNDWHINMAGIYAKKKATEDSRWGVEFLAQDGKDDEIFGFAATAPNLKGADFLRHLGLADVSYLAPVGKGLTVQGGIFSSFIGYDSLYARDNFTYTRPWGADYTPYLMLGLNASYPITDRLTVTGIVVNGYWHLAHANNVPSVGGQLAYSVAAGTTFKQTVLYGPHQEDTSIGLWRVLSNSIVERKAGRVTLVGDLQVSTEQVDTVDRAWWVSFQTPVRWAVSGDWSVALRPEWCRDSRGRWTNSEQTITAFTTTLEYRLARVPASVRLRGEYRYDRSTGAGGGFFTGRAGTTGTPPLTPAQHLAIAAVIVSFDGMAGGK